jgi:hypothetical protein
MEILKEAIEAVRADAGIGNDTPTDVKCAKLFLRDALNL